MPILKLNRRNIAAIVPADKPTIYFDTDLKGFGLMVQPSGTRSWIVEYRVGAGGRSAAKKRMVLGKNSDLLPPETAREMAKTTLARVHVGANPAAQRSDERSSATIKTLCELFLERHVEAKRKARTAELYRQIISTHIVPRLGSVRAVSLTRADVADMHAAIAKPVDGVGGRYVANRSVAILSAIYGWADGAGLVPDDFNPTRKVEKFEERSRERYLTTSELERLGAVLRQAETTGLGWRLDDTKPTSKHTPKANRVTIVPVHVTAAIRLLMFTGCRLREILNLEWRDVDLERGLLFLPDSKTGKKTVVLASPALTILDGLPRVGRYVIAGDTAGQKDEVPRADLKRPWAAVTNAAELNGLRLHDLRHTFASIGVGGGLGLPIIGGLLGHADTKTTQKYAHLDADPARVAANVIAGKISAAMEARDE